MNESKSPIISVEGLLEFLQNYQGDFVVELNNPMGHYQENGYFDDHSIEEIVSDLQNKLNIHIDKNWMDIANMTVRDFIDYILTLCK